MDMLGKCLFIGEALRTDCIIQVIIGPVVLCGHEMPELVKQGMRIMPFKPVLLFIVQKNRQYWHTCFNRDIKRPGLKTGVDPTPLTAAFGEYGYIPPVLHRLR